MQIRQGATAATTTTATTAEEFSAKARPGIPTHPGIKYPVRETPHSDLIPGRVGIPGLALAENSAVVVAVVVALHQIC